MVDNSINSTFQITSGITPDVIGLPKTLEQHIRDILLSDQELATMFEGYGRDLASAIFPRALNPLDPEDQLGINTPTPFIVMRFGGESGQMVYVTPFTFWLYDSTEERYWRLDDLATYLRKKFEGLQIPASRPGHTQWQGIRYEYKSAQQNDLDWDKNLVFIRFSTYGI